MSDPILLQDRAGLHVRRREEVALVRPEAHGRLEVSTAAGEVFFHPGPLAALAGPPFVEGGGVLVHPRHAQLRDGVLEFRAGWRVPWGGGALPEPVEPAPSPLVPGLKVRQDEVVYLHAERLRTRWVTDAGEIPEKDSAVRARLRHPGLVPAGNHWINPRRLRALLPEKHRIRLVLAGDRELTVYRSSLEPLLAGLGVPSLDSLQGWTREAEVLLEHGLRDWPEELFQASGAWLREHLGQDFAYVAESVLWQTVRLRAAGAEPDYNVDFRGYWYRPLLVVFTKLGMLSQEQLWKELSHGGPPPDELVQLARSLDPQAAGLPSLAGRDLYRDYQVLAGALVGEERLFTYSDLGFEEPRPDLRAIGEERPGLLVLAEKATTRSLVTRLADRFGASHLILGGQASLLVTEFFVRALRTRWAGPVRVVAHVDYDPWGWIIARAFCDQLRRFGVEVEDLGFLVRPQRFTPEELRDLTVPLPDTNATVRATVANWMAETGGVQGRRCGLHSDHLRPLERLVRAMAEETGLEAPAEVSAPV